MGRVEDLGAKVNKCIQVNECINIFCSIGQDHSLTFITNVCHSLTVSNNQVYTDDEFDSWPVYSSERFRAS